jgi:HEPN domain-containing protein
MRRKQSDETDPADWFYLAGDRLRAADLLWNVEGLTASGIELLQESAERYLKGYLVARGWRLVKTHDLEALLDVAVTFDPAFSRYAAFAEELTEDFFAQHYPGQDWSETGQNYEELRRQAGDVVALIQRSLPQFFPSAPMPNTSSDTGE